jgi:hypothetical protein
LDYTHGRRLRWLLGDLDSLYLRLKDTEHFSWGERLARILSFLRPSMGRTRDEVNRLHDLGPAKHELMQYVRDAFRSKR